MNKGVIFGIAGLAVATMMVYVVINKKKWDEEDDRLAKEMCDAVMAEENKRHEQAMKDIEEEYKRYAEQEKKQMEEWKKEFGEKMKFHYDKMGWDSKEMLEDLKNL